jgi:hypothetical protein
VKVENVPGCDDHTALDQMGQRFRTRDCVPYCSIKRELSKPKPLTIFLTKLMKYSDANLLKAKAATAAKHYGISKDHAAGYIRMEITQRGLAHGKR